MVRPKGLEPLAHCLEGSCSIHLSYGRIHEPLGTLLVYYSVLFSVCQHFFSKKAEFISSFRLTSLRSLGYHNKGFIYRLLACARQILFPPGASANAQPITCFARVFWLRNSIAGLRIFNCKFPEKGKEAS